MEFTKGQNELVLDDGTRLVAVGVDRWHTCGTCQIACRFSGRYDNVARCRERFKCHPEDRNDKRNIIWRLKEKDPMETKEEMFNRIFQRMKNRRYVGTVTGEGPVPSACITKMHDRVFATYAMRHGFAELVGNDCCIDILTIDSTERTQPLDVGANCLIMDGVCFTKNTTFGNGCLFEGHNMFDIGDHTFGDGCIFGPGCTFEGKCTFGKDCVFLCDDPTAKPKPTILKEFKMSGVDGSGREITITIWSDWTIKVKAGCFNGTLEEFCEKARKEKKMFYVHVVEDAADAALQLLKKEAE